MSGKVKLTVRLDPQEDADLLAWLETQRRLGYGSVSREVKAALRAWVQGGASSTGSPVLDLETLLAEVRQVVEAALSTALEGLTLHPASQAPADGDETAALLDALGEHLLLDDEEDD